MKQAYLVALIMMIATISFTFDCDSQFESFKEKFNKTYPSEEEEERRKEIYCQNLQKIQTYNSENHSDKKRVYANTDQTSQEIKRSRAGLKFKKPEQRTESPIKVSANVGAPTSLDWRDYNGKNYVTSIKDQGSCGSCWTFATNAYAESRLIIKGTHDTDLDLSEQYLLQCTPECDCNGGYMENVMKQALQGVPLEETYPYTPYSTYYGICSASGVHIAYKNYDHYNLTDDQMITLLQDGPLAIALSADGWQNYASGTFNCALNSQVNHAVTIVGYTPDTWIIKNQWGTSWGDNGYITITRDRLYNCQIGIAAHTMFGDKLNFAFLSLIILVLGFMI